MRRVFAPSFLNRWNRVGLSLLLAGATACSTVSVRLTGTKGAGYNAGITSEDGFQQLSGVMPARITLPKEDAKAWFETTTSGADFRVRVYQGFSLMMDMEFTGTPDRVIIKKEGNRISSSREF